MSDANEWLLIKRDLYWRPDGAGYTGIRDHAGRYSYAEAKEWVRDSESGITMIKASEAPEFSKACFDDLARAHLMRQRDEARIECERMRAALEYLFGDRSDVHPMFGGKPNVGDFAFTAFMRGRSPNEEDGGSSDWFNDTLPVIYAGIRKWREELKLPPNKSATARDCPTEA